MFQGQTLQPGTLTEDQMRFTGIARTQGPVGLGRNTGPEMFRDQLTNELVTKAQMDSFGGMQTLLTPSQKSSVAERNRADLFGMQAAQEIMPQPILSTGRPMSGTGQATPPDPNTIRFHRGGGGTLPPGYYQEPPRRPSMENPSGSLGGQIRPNPYSAPPQIGGGFGGQMGGGMGGGQGMGQFMQFMQTMMQMFQQFQGGGGRGMGGGFGGPSPFMPQQQRYGQYQPQQQTQPGTTLMTQGPASMMRTQRMSNQFNPNNAFGGY